MFKVGVKTIGLDVVNAKLLMAAPRILEQNRLMVGAMLAEIKPIVIANTPLGPGHFGYHLRDRFTTDLTSEGRVTKGVLKAPATGYWREYGTGPRFRKTKGNSARLRSYVAAIGGFGDTGGERAFMTAHKATSGVKRIITQYYGGMARWYRL